MLYTPKDSKGVLNHWTGTSFVQTENTILVEKDREINLFWLCICYQSILPFIKNKKHPQNIGRMHIKELLKGIAVLKIFTGSALRNR